VVRPGPEAGRPPWPVNLQNNSSLLLTSSTNLHSWVAPVDDHEQGNDPCTQRQAHPSTSSRSKVNMLEIKNEWGKPQRRDEDLFPEVHRPQRKGYVSVEELVREFSHNKPGLFQLLSSFPLRRSFHEEARSQPLQTCRCSPQPWELTGDAEPSRRRTSKSNKCFKGFPTRTTSAQAMGCSWSAHTSSQRLKLSTQHKDMAWIANLTKRELGSVYLALAYEKQ
jgi:hypothetical protein